MISSVNLFSQLVASIRAPVVFAGSLVVSFDLICWIHMSRSLRKSAEGIQASCRREDYLFAFVIKDCVKLTYLTRSECWILNTT
jgi:hypothetical protein